MLNSESDKRSNERLKTLHRRKKQYERIHSKPIKQKEPDDWDSVQKERHETLIENIPCAVYSAYPGKTGPTTFISNKWEDWTGYSPEELYHDPEAWPRCIHPDDREYAVNAYIGACRDRMAYNLEYRIVHKDTKQVRYVRDQGHLSKDKKSAVVRVDGIVTDITELKKAKNELDKYKDRLEELVRKRTAELTSAYETLKVENKERKRAEQALREIEREKTTVLENLSDLMVFRDRDMVTRWASKSMAKWHGMTQDQIVGRICYKARYGLDEPCEECHIIDAMKSGQRQELEKQLPGEIYWHVSVNPVFNDSGLVIGTIEVSQDITDRKKAREELEKSKDILEKTFSSLDSAVFILDAQKPPLIIDCNPASTIIFGYGKEEMLGRTTEFLHISREKLLEFQKALNQSIQEQGGLSFFEFKMQRKDGQIFPTEHSVRSLKDDKGRMIGWVSVVRDITERKQQDDLTAIQRDLAIKLSAAAELEDGLSLCLEAAIGASEMDCGGIYLVDEDSGALELAVHSGLSVEFVNHVYQYKMDSGNSRLVMNSEPVYTEYAQLGAVLDQTEKREGLSAIAVIPILNDSRVIGCLNVASHTSKQIHARSRLALETIAAQVGSTVARLKTEDALRKSEELARASLNATNDMVYLIDTSRNILAANDIAARNLGKTPDELIGTNIFSYFPPDIAKSRGEYGNEVISSGKHVRFQDEHEGKFYDVSIYPTFDSQGRVDRLAVFVTDITELKQSEQALRETTDLLETVFEHTHMLAAYLDPQFNFVRVNRAYAEADEREPSFFVGRNHFDLYPNADNESIFHKVVETGVPYFTHAKAFEYAGHPERGVTYWNWSLVPVKQQDGVVCGLILTLADVTEQKRAEQALRESEERFRKVFEEGPIGMVLTSRDLKFFSANPAFCKMLGYKAEEMSSKTFLDVTHPAHRDADRENVEKMWRGEIQHYMTEKRYLAKNGDIRWGSLSTSLIRGQDGEPLYALAMVDDITDRKGTEDTLRQYEFMVESAHDAIFFKDRQSRYIIANEKTLESFGLSHEQVIGKSDYEIMPEREQAKQNIDDDQAVLETGKPKEIIKEMTGADGEKRWFQAIKVPQFDENGDVIGLIGIARDITKHKRVDEELRIREQKLRALLNAPTESAILVDTEGTIQDINRIAAQRLGKSVKSLIGMGIYDYLHTDIAEYRQAQGYEVVRSGKPVRFQDGRKGRYYDNNIYPVFDDEGKVSALAVFSTDITERRQAEEALRISSDIVRSIPSGLFTYKYEPPDKLFLLDGNPAAERLANIKVSECIGKDFNDIWPQARYRGITDNFLMVMKTGKTYETEDQYYEDEKLEGAFRVCAFTMSKELLGVAFENITQQKLAEAALRESEEKFRSLAEQSPNMIFINKKGKFVYANKKCEEVMGYKKEELCSPDFDFLTLIAPESVAVVKKSFAKHSRGEDVQPYDYSIISKDGKRIEAINASKLIQYEGQTAILGIVTDITERKRAEQALRESEERLKILFESAPDTIYLIDSEGRFMDANRAAFDLIGFARDEVIGKSLAELGLLSAGQLSKAKANLKKVVAGKLSGPNEYVLKRKDGTYVTVEIRTFPVKISGKILTLGIARDITEHKRTEQKLLEHQAKLKSLASQLSLTEERERHRLATELHDQISQSLVISKIKLDQLRKSSTSNEFNKSLEDICNCLSQIIDDTRTLTFDLSYPILYELGFEAAVAEWLTDQIQEKHRIKTEFEDDRHQKPLDDDIRVLLFRNVRELLINVVKHAQANKVKVSIRRVNEHINVNVEDDGVGFDPIEVMSMATKRAEFGLFSIRERLEQLGGLIEIDSEPGRGSKITMTAPLKYDNSTDRTQK